MRPHVYPGLAAVTTEHQLLTVQCGCGRETGPGAGREPGPAALPAAERLAEIPGVSLKLARAVIAETGLDMTRFPTARSAATSASSRPSASKSPSPRPPPKNQNRR
ncbi:MAG: transposase [Trebonia sp.]